MSLLPVVNSGRLNKENGGARIAEVDFIVYRLLCVLLFKRHALLLAAMIWRSFHHKNMNQQIPEFVIPEVTSHFQSNHFVITILDMTADMSWAYSKQNYQENKPQLTPLGTDGAEDGMDASWRIASPPSPESNQLQETAPGAGSTKVGHDTVSSTISMKSAVESCFLKTTVLWNTNQRLGLMAFNMLRI